MTHHHFVSLPPGSRAYTHSHNKKAANRSKDERKNPQSRRRIEKLRMCTLYTHMENPSVRRLVTIGPKDARREARRSIDRIDRTLGRRRRRRRTYRECDGDVGGGGRKPLPRTNIKNPLDELRAVRRVMRARDVEDEVPETLALPDEHLCARARVELGTVWGGVAGARRA